MEDIRMYLSAEIILQVILPKIEFLLEQARTSQPGEAISCEVANDFPVIVEEAGAVDNIISLMRKPKVGYGAFTIKQFRRAMSLPEFREMERKALELGYVVRLQYTLVTPDLLVAPEALRMSDAVQGDPLLGVMNGLGMVVEDLVLLLVPEGIPLAEPGGQVMQTILGPLMQADNQNKCEVR